MTLLAWPLASFIYRTRSTGNPPPRSPLVSLAGTLLPATQLSSTVGRVVLREQVPSVVVMPALGCFSQSALVTASALPALQLKEGYRWQNATEVLSWARGGARINLQCCQGWGCHV